MDVPNSNGSELARETVFLNMQIRKTNRALSGSQSGGRGYEFVAMTILLVVIFSLGAQTEQGVATGLDTNYLVKLSITEVIVLLASIFMR